MTWLPEDPQSLAPSPVAAGADRSPTLVNELGPLAPPDRGGSDAGRSGGAGAATMPLLAAAAAGGAVSLAIGTYGRVHQATGGKISTFGFPTLVSMKVWLATAVFVLALAQLTSALAMWGRLPGVHSTPSWLPLVHRWSGTTAFVLSLPVAYHCLWSLGFQDGNTRVLVHAIAGCAFYGAMTTKLLALRIERLPGLALPLLGGLLVTCLTVIWLTSALWFFTNVDFPAL
jgi:hypothetical protein